MSEREISPAETRFVLGILTLRDELQGFRAHDDFGRAVCASVGRGEASGSKDGEEEGGSGAHRG